ncbi:hypothetical protein Tco_0882871, partial [Tanacetum coccineum]
MTMSGVGKLVNVLTPSTLIHGNIGPQAVHLLAAAMLRLAEQNSAESTRREWYSSSSVYSIYKNSIIALMFRALKGDICCEYRNRLNTLATQKAADINLYPHRFQQTISYPEYRRKYENLENGEHRYIE